MRSLRESMISEGTKVKSIKSSVVLSGTSNEQVTSGNHNKTLVHKSYMLVNGNEITFYDYDELTEIVFAEESMFLVLGSVESMEERKGSCYIDFDAPHAGYTQARLYRLY